jgi:hypothetical protein
MTRGMRLRWVSTRSFVRHESLVLDTPNAIYELGTIHREQVLPNTYVARLATGKIGRSTNRRRLRSWLRRQVAEQLEQVARRERRAG